MSDLLVETIEGIAWVTINRPQAANAMDRETKQHLLDFFSSVDRREDVGVIIIRGAGQGSFCAGTDLKEMATFSPLDAEQMLKLEHRLNDAIRKCGKPVIAAVGGHALGGGLVMALVCDYSIVSEEATLGFPEIKAGLPASIEIAMVHKFIGLARSRQLIYFGEPFEPAEALSIGLINEVVPAKRVYQRAEEVAHMFLSLSPTALRLQKELINKWIESDFISAVETSMYAAGLSFTTGEPQKAIEDFLAKRTR